MTANNENLENETDADDAKDPRKQWTNAFVRLTQVLLEDYKDKVQILAEHDLFRKPISIDAVIIKRDPSIVIDNAVMRFFRTHNIVEFKSPKDTFNIESFDKTLGYFHVYLSEERRSTESLVTFNDVAITIVSVRKPRKALGLLQSERNYKIVETETPGIYYIKGGDTVPAIQLVISSELPSDGNDSSFLWLRAFRDNLTTAEAVEAVKKAKEKDDYSDPVWDVVRFLLKANPKISEEVEKMTAYEEVCQMIAGGRIAKAANEAREENSKNIARKMIAKGRPVDEIVEFTGLDLNTVLHLQGE